MMHTFIGNLTADPTTHNTPDGRTSIHLRIAVSERYRDSRTGEWKSKEPTFWDAYAWNAKAEAIAAQQWRKGTPVIIVGELVANVWTDQETGQQRRKTNIAIEAAGKNDSIPLRKRDTAPAAPRPRNGVHRSPNRSSPRLQACRALALLTQRRRLGCERSSKAADRQEDRGHSLASVSGCIISESALT